MLYSYASFNTLSTELILKIIEFLDYEPTLIDTLENTSSWLRDVVRGNEKSLSWYFAQQLHAEPEPLISSTIEHISLPPRSFIWLSELYFRDAAVEALAAHYALKTKHGQFSFFNTDVICEHCQDIRMRRFKIKNLRLLFLLSDCTICIGEDQRLAQKIFFKHLSEEDLAGLMTFLILVSRGYTMNEYAEESVEPADYLDQSEINERECVYRELVLKHGAFFIWVSVCGNDRQKEWVKMCIDSGIKLFNYEKTSPELRVICASSFLYEEFCAKANCDITNVSEVRRKVGKIMLQEVSDERHGGPVVHINPVT